jgi:hypothetical protein
MKKVRNIICIAVLALAVFLIVYGVITGEFNDVFNKARMICYECIGLG